MNVKINKLTNDPKTTKEKFIEWNKKFSECSTIVDGFELLLKEKFLCNIFKTFVGNSFYIKHKTSILILEKMVNLYYTENKKDYIVLDNILKDKELISIKVLVLIRMILNISYTRDQDNATKDVILKTLNNIVDEIILIFE